MSTGERTEGVKKVWYGLFVNKRISWGQVADRITVVIPKGLDTAAVRRCLDNPQYVMENFHQQEQEQDYEDTTTKIVIVSSP
ncbi:hypothetical protein MFLAVUS_002376 [Mucor flavus]|uniref:Uncharacterized protein n=1 Tax=Mucor flavus TaxID=439312 RepID=A0ABP9YQ30_9FUNG